MMRFKKHRYSKVLMCSWYGWEQVGPGRLALYLRDQDCCHMPGAIALAKKFMPDVVFIQTYSGDKIDVGYFKMDSCWAVNLPPGWRPNLLSG